VLRNDLFDRKLSDRLIEMATEGRGAVTNAWVKPEVVETDTTEAEAPEAATARAETAENAESETGATDGGEDKAAPGECPADRPIKGNADSMIYHAPGSRSYARTIPEVCFATTEEAEAAGYRAAKGEGHVGQVEGDGSRDCPEKFPIKGNSSSMIYHLPGGRSYDQTIPEVCFATEDDAAAAGYRASKAGAAHADANEDDDEE
jgi:hypothetical protein